MSSLISIQFGLHTLYRLRELPDNKILGNQIPEGATVVVDIQKVITVRKMESMEEMTLLVSTMIFHTRYPSFQNFLSERTLVAA